MSEWSDDFFCTWQKAWNTGTDAVLEYVTDDIEYWDVTLAEPIRGKARYADYCDGFFAAFSELNFTMREPVIH
ncbi:MAG: nuclear transport factor 2 family protein, partial [Solirubrobacterales bacterium]